MVEIIEEACDEMRPSQAFTRNERNTVAKKAQPETKLIKCQDTLGPTPCQTS